MHVDTYVGIRVHVVYVLCQVCRNTSLIEYPALVNTLRCPLTHQANGRPPAPLEAQWLPSERIVYYP